MMYLDYWGLEKHPFNNVPDPAMYFDMHQSVDDAVGELLFAIDEGDEVLAVVVGPVGAGKTMSLRIVLDSIDHEKYRIAFVTNPDMTFPQLLREIIGQLQGALCEEKRRDKLLEIFNRMLFETHDSGKRILIFIDEGNVIKPHNLESLRLLTNMQDDKNNLFTIILAGQPELGRRLEDPRRANLFQRIGVYCNIRGIDSLDTMRDYIDHRLERAGLAPERRIFTDDAYRALWDFSENGIPRMINKICKLALKAAETNRLDIIDEKVVAAVGSRFSRTYTKQTKRPATQEKTEVVAQNPVRTRPRTTEVIEPGIEIPPVPMGNISSTAVISPKQEGKEKFDPVKTVSVEKKSVVKDETGEHVERTSIRNQILSQEELEELASKLATTRIKEIKQVSDPFEAWEKARSQILEQLRQSNEEKKSDDHKAEVSDGNGQG